MNSINLRLLLVVLIYISAAGASQAQILSPYLTEGIVSSAIHPSSTATNANRNNDNYMHPFLLVNY